jgi:hypothetical protein
LPASVAGFGEPLHLLLKTTVDPHTLVSSVVRAVRAVDPNVVVSPAGSLGDFLDDEFRAPAFEFRTLGAFGGIGLILAGVGIFSVMAYTVSLQRHSIGVRMALGAAPRDILRMVLKNGIALIVSGVAIGPGEHRADAVYGAPAVGRVGPRSVDLRRSDCGDGDGRLRRLLPAGQAGGGDRSARDAPH